MNLSRVILGGLLAGLIINTVEYLVNGVILQKDWNDVMAAMNRPAISGGQIGMFVLLGFVTGIFAMWLYAAIRPRYGPGPRTAMTAGFAVWFLGNLMASVVPLSLQLMPARMMYIGMGVGLVETLLATVVGAAVYKEAGIASAMSAAIGR